MPALLISVLFEVTERLALRPSGFSMYQLHYLRTDANTPRRTLYEHQLICTGSDRHGREQGEFATLSSAALEMTKRLTPYMIKAVTNGRGDEVVDLAKDNLWR